MTGQLKQRTCHIAGLRVVCVQVAECCTPEFPACVCSTSTEVGKYASAVLKQLFLEPESVDIHQATFTIASLSLKHMLLETWDTRGCFEWERCQSRRD
jgi:hypothetical protein